MKKLTSVAAVLREIISPKELMMEVLKWLDENSNSLDMTASFMSADPNAQMSIEGHICQAVGLNPKGDKPRMPLYVDVAGQRDLIEFLKKLPDKTTGTFMQLPHGTIAYTFDVCRVLLGIEKRKAESLLVFEHWPDSTRKQYEAFALNGNFTEAKKVAVRYLRQAMEL